MKTFCLDSEDAVKYGVEEAIILYHFRYWINVNKINNKHNYEGRHWCYNSFKSLLELFPFFKNESKCCRLIQNLMKDGVLVKGNFNKKGYDRTVWYTLNDGTAIATKPSEDEEDSVKTDGTISQNRQINQSKLTEPSVKIDGTIRQDRRNHPSKLTEPSVKTDGPIPITLYNKTKTNYAGEGSKVREEIVNPQEGEGYNFSYLDDDLLLSLQQCFPE
jgi:hypothetical protein